MRGASLPNALHRVVLFDMAEPAAVASLLRAMPLVACVSERANRLVGHGDSCRVRMLGQSPGVSQLHLLSCNLGMTYQVSDTTSRTLPFVRVRLGIACFRTPSAPSSWRRLSISSSGWSLVDLVTQRAKSNALSVRWVTNF